MLRPFFVTALFLLLLAACENDSTGPLRIPDPWQESTIAGLESGFVPWRLATGAGRTLAIAIDDGFDTRVLERSGDGTWTSVDPGWPDDVVVFDVLVTSSGRGVAVGGTFSGDLFVAVEASTWSTTSIVSGPGLLLCVIERTDRSVLAVGQGTSGVPIVEGTLGGAWSVESLPLSGVVNDKALQALVEAGGIVYAAGFDDGGNGSPESPFRFLLRDTGSGFDGMPAPCQDCARREFDALAATASGAVLVGGAVTDFSAEAPDAYVAALALWSPALEEWTEVVLPKAGELDRVREILVATNGSIVFACGESDGAALVVQPPSGPATIEWTEGGDVELLDMTALEDGTVVVVGTRGADAAAFLLERRPD